MGDLNGFIIFALGSIFGISMSYAVCDLVFPPNERVEDDDADLYS